MFNSIKLHTNIIVFIQNEDFKIKIYFFNGLYPIHFNANDRYLYITFTPLPLIPILISYNRANGIPYHYS